MNLEIFWLGKVSFGILDLGEMSLGICTWVSLGKLELGKVSFVIFELGEASFGVHIQVGWGELWNIWIRWDELLIFFSFVEMILYFSVRWDELRNFGKLTCPLCLLDSF